MRIMTNVYIETLPTELKLYEKHLIQSIFTCSHMGLASASFCKQSLMNEQNSDEWASNGGVGDGSSSIWITRYQVK